MRQAGVDAPGWLVAAGSSAAIMPLVLLGDVFFPFVVSKAVWLRLAISLPAAALLWHFFMRRLKPLRKGFDPFLWAVLLLCAVLGLAAAFGPDPDRSFWGGLQRMWGVATWVYLLALYVLLGLFGPRRWDWMLRLTLAVSAAVGLYAIVLAVPRMTGGAAFDLGHVRIGSTLGNGGYLSAYALLNLGLAAYLWNASTDRRKLVLLGLAGALNLIAFLLGNTRAAAVGLFVGLAAGMLLYAALIRSWHVAGGLVGVALLGVGLIVFARVAPEHPVVDRMPLLGRLAATERAETNVSARLLLWSVALDGVRDRPVLGWGPESFGLVWSQEFDPEVYRTIPRHTYPDRVHNALLEALLAGGILGALAYLGLWAGFLFNAWRAYCREGLSAAGFAILTGTGLAYLVYLLFWFEDLSSVLVLVTLAAYLAFRARGGPLMEVRPAGGPVAASRRMVALVAVLVVGLLTYRHAVRVWQAARAAHEARQPDRAVEERLALYARATHPSVPEAREVLVPWVEYLQDFAPELNAIRADPYRSQVILRSVALADERIQRVIAAVPSYDLWHLHRAGLLTFALGLTQNPELYVAAVQEYETAIRLSPYRVRHRHLLASLHAAAGYPERGHAVLQPILEGEDLLGETAAFKALVLLAEGRPTAASEWLGRAYERGYTGQRELLDQVITALVAEKRFAPAADLAEEYLAARYPAERRRTLSPQDEPLARSISTLRLRAGQPEKAVEAVRWLQLQQPPGGSPVGPARASG